MREDGRYITPILLGVIVGTLKTLEALVALLTRLGLVHEWMEELLFPAVAHLAMLEAFAALFVAGDESTALPILTQIDLVAEQVWAASEILEVVGVHALSLVVLLIEWAPLRLEVEHVVVKVRLNRHAKLLLAP